MNKQFVTMVFCVLLLSVSAAAIIIPNPLTPQPGSMFSRTQFNSSFQFVRRLGVERVTHFDPRINVPEFNTMVYLEPAVDDKFKGNGRGGANPFYPRGTAHVRASDVYGFPNAEVVINTKDLRPTYEIGSIYEAWLVDSESGYRLSLGTFTTVFGGVGALVYVVNNYIDSYDKVEVTVEPYDDLDVTPGPTVLVGNIARPRLYEPPPKDSKMATGPLTKI